MFIGEFSFCGNLRKIIICFYVMSIRITLYEVVIVVLSEETLHFD